MGLNPRILHTVVAVGAENLNAVTGEQMHVSASAFLYAYPKPWTTGKSFDDLQLWLVTCRHVIDSLRPRGKTATPKIATAQMPLYA